MDVSQILEFTINAAYLTLMLSMAPIIAATVVGLLVSLLQALTQIQEQTLGFAVKLIVVTIVLLMTARWMGSEIYTFTINIFEIIPTTR